MKKIDYKKSSGYFVIQFEGEEPKKFSVHELSDGAPILEWIVDLEPSLKNWIFKPEYNIRFKLLEKKVVLKFYEQFLSTPYNKRLASNYNSSYENLITKTGRVMFDKINYLFYYNPNEWDKIGTISSEIIEFKRAFDYPENINYSIFSKYVSIVEKYVLKELIKNLLELVLCCVPSSVASKQNNSSISRMIVVLKKHNENNSNIINGANVILRNRTIERSSSNMVPRTVTRQYNSIEIENKEIIQNKMVLLLDDIYTTGSSVEACKKKLLEAGAKSVVIVTIGRTRRY